VSDLFKIRFSGKVWELGLFKPVKMLLRHIRVDRRIYILSLPLKLGVVVALREVAALEIVAALEVVVALGSGIGGFWRSCGSLVKQSVNLHLGWHPSISPTNSGLPVLHKLPSGMILHRRLSSKSGRGEYKRKGFWSTENN
jgi:hypothetical protein